MIITSSIEIYDTKKIKESLNTQINELSSNGMYDYYPTPKMKIVDPIGGTIFYNDTPINIEWYTYAWQSLPSASLYFTSNNGKNVMLLANVTNTETSSYEWTIPSDISVPVTSSKILISGSYDGKTISAESLAYFTIATRSLEILDFEVSGAILNKNNVYPIRWKSDGTSGFLDIEAHFPDYVVPIVKKYAIPDTERYDWNVTTGSDYIENYTPVKIVIKDSNTFQQYAISKDIPLSISMFKSITGYRASFPTVQPVNAQGIFKYKEYAIEILDDIGSAYARRSRITLTGHVGVPYAKPSVRFVVKNPQYNIILGDVRYPLGNATGGGL